MKLYERIKPSLFPVYQAEVDASDNEKNYREVINLTEEIDHTTHQLGKFAAPEQKTVDGNVVWVTSRPVYPITNAELEDMLTAERAQALVDIQNTAGAARLAIASNGSYQEAEYQEKAKQAALFLADTSLTEADVPMIFVNVGTSDGSTAAKVAKLYDDKAKEWNAALAHISGVRRRALDAATDAATVADVRAVMTDLEF